MKKPKRIYQPSPFIVLYHYGDGDYAENKLYIPEPYYNFHSSVRDFTDPIELRKGILESICDRIIEDEVDVAEVSNLINNTLKPIILYYIAFDNADEATEFEDLISDMTHNGERKLDINEYHKLVGWLSRGTEVEIQAIEILNEVWKDYEAAQILEQNLHPGTLYTYYEYLKDNGTDK